MEIINIAPKDIHVTLDLSITEIIGLLTASEKVQLVYDSEEDPDMIKADGIFKAFFKLLSEVEEEVGPAKREPT